MKGNDAMSSTTDPQAHLYLDDDLIARLPGTRPGVVA
jgi:hypothetical protein